MKKKYLAVAGALVLAALPLRGVRADATDAQIAQIIDEGLSHSQAMVNASELMDGIGPRLTNSENFDKAAAWALAKFKTYGLDNIHAESYPFGVSWNLDSWSATMIEPRMVVMRSIPVAWSPPTNGTLSAPVILAPMTKKENFDKWRSKLAGKIVLVSLPGEASQSDKPMFLRYEAKDLSDKDHYDLPSDELEPYKDFAKRAEFALELSKFLESEGAVAIVRKSGRENGLVSGEGYNINPKNGPTFPVAIPRQGTSWPAGTSTVGSPPTGPPLPTAPSKSNPFKVEDPNEE